MKAPTGLLKFATYAFASALFVFIYATLTNLLGTSRTPTTIDQFLLLFMMQFGTSILIDFYMNRRKNPPAPSEAQ